MVWLLHKFGIVDGIYLQSFCGNVYRTWRIRPFRTHANVYPFCKDVGEPAQLNDDGTVSHTYCVRWQPMK